MGETSLKKWGCLEFVLLNGKINSSQAHAKGSWNPSNPLLLIETFWLQSQQMQDKIEGL